MKKYQHTADQLANRDYYINNNKGYIRKNVQSCDDLHAHLHTEDICDITTANVNCVTM